MKVQFVQAISDIPRKLWNSLCPNDYPFIRHEFLLSLETSGAVSLNTGWQPHHALVYKGDEAIAMMPAYLKSHSYGEFVFDFQWAEAYQRNGLSYYPKLITAIPFSPVTGPRVCIKQGCDEAEVLQAVITACIELVKEKNLSSWHFLFPEEHLANKLSGSGLPIRKAVQFHWFNNDYKIFDDFLGAFNSRHRKNLRKEREKVQQQGITLQRLEGCDITDMHWQKFYHFYQLTYAKRSGHGGYLGPDFFIRLGRDMPEQLIMVIAIKEEQIIAAALNLKDANTLYGRYWGCYEEFDFLHFEACYYQGIEYCIEKGLLRFDPGAQGEHKIQRGFKPVFTYSSHWIADPQFRQAIHQFLKREEEHVQQYQRQAEELLPFRQD